MERSEQADPDSRKTFHVVVDCVRLEGIRPRFSLQSGFPQERVKLGRYLRRQYAVAHRRKQASNSKLSRRCFVNGALSVSLES